MQTTRYDFAFCRPLAVAVESLSLVAHHPVVQQCVARAGVKATVQILPIKQSDVGYTADVHDGAVHILFRESGGVKGGGQRCALATCGDVPAPEVGNCGNAGALGDGIGVADLQGKTGGGIGGA